MRGKILPILLMLLAGTAFARAQDYISPNTIGQSKLLCTSDAGTEIKDEADFDAPSGMYFTEVHPEEAEQTVSHAGGDIGCLEWPRGGGKRYSTVTATLGGRQVPVQVVTGIHILAHADCGSGMGPVLSRWDITALCRIRGALAPLGQ